MRKLFLFLTFLLCQTFSFGQIITLKEEEFTKVEVFVDELVPPMKYLKDFAKKNNYNYEGLDIVMRERIKTDEQFQEYQKRIASRNRYSTDTVNVKDSLTIFYQWRPEGVFQITARKVLKENFPFQKKTNSRRSFSSIWSSNYQKSAEKTTKLFGIKTKKGFSYYSFLIKSKFNSESNKVKEPKQFNNSYVFWKPIPLEITGQPEGWLYSISSISYYTFGGINSDSNRNQLHHYYKFASYTGHSIVGKKDLNSESHARLTNLTAELFEFSDYHHKKYFIKQESWENKSQYVSNFRIPLLSINTRGNETRLTTPATDSNLKVEFHQFNNCSYGYTVINDELKTEPKGILVVPNKFFLSQRLKILSVNDKPWEKYKADLCK